MKYQIAYLNHYGNAKILAQEIYWYLSGQQAEITNIASQDVCSDADVYLLCFEITKGTIPIEILEAMEYLEHKTLFLFVTYSASLAEKAQKIETRIVPFLPDGCDYRGTFTCTGQFPEEIMAQVSKVLETHPDSEKAKLILENCRLCQGHPNAEDKAALQMFLRRNLNQ